MSDFSKRFLITVNGTFNLSYFTYITQSRSSRPEMVCTKHVLKSFSEYARKHFCRSLFIDKVAGLGLQRYLKKDSDTGLSCQFCTTFKNTFFTEHLQPTAPENTKKSWLTWITEQAPPSSNYVIYEFLINVFITTAFVPNLRKTLLKSGLCFVLSK